MQFELTDANFKSEVLENPEPVLVDFFATWCSPCMMMMPIIEDIADYYTDINIARANISDVPEMVEKFGIRSVPTLIVFKKGEIAGRTTGYHSEDEIINFFKSVK